MRQVMPPEGAFADALKLQYVPILIQDDGSYPVEANRYLDERCNGEWFLPGAEQKEPVVPTLKSRRNIASRLALFLNWALRTEVDWRRATYDDDIVSGYQDGLIRGDAAASGRVLEHSTVNLYVDEACLFLSWAAERGYRARFEVRARQVNAACISATSAYSGRKIQRTVRGSALRPARKPLLVPSNEEVARWIKGVAWHSPVKALIFELICRSGPRISEANQLRTSCFPDKSYEGQVAWDPNWVAMGSVPLTLRYGVKGPKVSPASMVSARPRTVFMPIDLAERIWHYKSVVRPTLLSRFRRYNPGAPQTDRLWIGEQKLQPVSNQMLWETWTKAEHCPPGWSPHKGRHYFAVEQIVESARSLLKVHELSKVGGADFGWLHGLLAGQVKVILSPLMGHSNESTTQKYLQAAMTKLTRDAGHPAMIWNDIIDAGRSQHERENQ